MLNSFISKQEILKINKLILKETATFLRIFVLSFVPSNREIVWSWLPSETTIPGSPGGIWTMECEWEWPGQANLVFFFLNLFYGGIVALQCSVSFCCTMKWISYMYTYIPSLLDFPPIPPFHPSRSPQSNELSSLCYTAVSH